MKRQLCLLATICLAGAIFAFAAPPILAQSSDAPAMLDLGGFDVFVIHNNGGGLTPQERVDQITDRLTPILGVPSIPPSCVRIYNPPGGNPSIYVLGRRIVTVDHKTAVAEGKLTPLQLATAWARKLQVILPQVNYRKPGQPLPDPNLKSTVTVTDDLSQVGGMMGEVTIGRHIVMRLRGVQPDGMTAAERADAIRTRLYAAIRSEGALPTMTLASNTAPTAKSAAPATPAPPGTPSAPTADSEASQAAPEATTPSTGSAPQPATSAPAEAAAPPDPVQIVPVFPDKPLTANSPVQIVVGGQTIITIDKPLAMAQDQPTVAALASSWAKNIRLAIAPAPKPAAAPAAPPAPAAQATPTAKIAPSVTDTGSADTKKTLL